MIENIILENQFVRLEPLDESHVSGLWKAATPDIWTYMPVAVESESDVAQFVAYAANVKESGQGLAFAVIDGASGKVVGSTGYWNYDAANKRVEIGFTWYTPSRQRTPVNTSCKLLLLGHAFEKLNLNRVEFKTDSLNERSRRAIARLGATEEGTLRNHMVQPDGRLRHSVYFSILKNEWPNVRKRLAVFLDK